MDYLKVNTIYQLSIFTLCEANTTGAIQSCSSSHAVQNLDFRSIIWEDLITSDFQPYLNALNVTADKLQLEGKLLNREHEYVPAIKATLALSILSIVFAFFMLIALGYLMFTSKVLSNKMWFGILFLSLCYVLFTCLSAVIVTAMVGIIKSGTYDDDYGVVYKSGSAYMGLMWTSFTLSILSFILIGLTFFKYRKPMPVEASDDEIVNKITTEQTDESSSSDHVNEKPIAA